MSITLTIQIDTEHDSHYQQIVREHFNDVVIGDEFLAGTLKGRLTDDAGVAIGFWSYEVKGRWGAR